ncbi:MAG: hypothetical protein ACI88A_004576 [Paraglaciecola sp.]
MICYRSVTTSKATRLHSNTDATDRYKHGDIARALAEGLKHERIAADIEQVLHDVLFFPELLEKIGWSTDSRGGYLMLRGQRFTDRDTFPRLKNFYLSNLAHTKR